MAPYWASLIPIYSSPGCLLRFGRSHKCCSWKITLFSGWVQNLSDPAILPEQHASNGWSRGGLTITPASPSVLGRRLAEASQWPHSSTASFIFHQTRCILLFPLGLQVPLIINLFRCFVNRLFPIGYRFLWNKADFSVITVYLAFSLQTIHKHKWLIFFPLATHHGLGALQFHLASV